VPSFHRLACGVLALSQQQLLHAVLVLMRRT
jgi:hypothetical protein